MRRELPREREPPGSWHSGRRSLVWWIAKAPHGFTAVVSDPSNELEIARTITPLLQESVLASVGPKCTLGGGMVLLAACGSLAVTLGLVVTRPRVGSDFRIGPAPAAAVGVLLMLATRVVAFADVSSAAAILWRPLMAIAALMVTTAVAQRIGLLERLATRLFARTGGSASRLFAGVFLLAALTAAALNNDAAVLLLTPAVVALVRGRYPGRPDLVIAFAFAVFMAAGVAPLVLSNPMNMIFAAYAGIDFNAYAVRMIPIWLVGGGVAAWTLYRIFRAQLASAPEVEASTAAPALEGIQIRMLVLMLAVLGSCPIVAYLGGPVWMVAVAGAALAIVLVARPSGAPVLATLRDGIAWDIVAFLVLVSVLGVGMRNAGLVARLSALYAGGSVLTVGLTSAVGLAVLNDHPMSIANMLALHESGTAPQALAALVGGDLGTEASAHGLPGRAVVARAASESRGRGAHATFRGDWAGADPPGAPPLAGHAAVLLMPPSAGTRVRAAMCVAALVAFLVTPACSRSSSAEQAAAGDAGEDVEGGAEPIDATPIPPDGSLLGDGGADDAGNCAAGTQLVYVASEEREIYLFDPVHATFQLMGSIDCAGGIYVNSMAVDRSGNAWIRLTATARCGRAARRGAAAPRPASSPGSKGWLSSAWASAPRARPLPRRRSSSPISVAAVWGSSISPP